MGFTRWLPWESGCGHGRLTQPEGRCRSGVGSGRLTAPSAEWLVLSLLRASAGGGRRPERGATGGGSPWGVPGARQRADSMPWARPARPAAPQPHHAKGGDPEAQRGPVGRERQGQHTPRPPGPEGSRVLATVLRGPGPSRGHVPDAVRGRGSQHGFHRFPFFFSCTLFVGVLSDKVFCELLCDVWRTRPGRGRGRGRQRGAVAAALSWRGSRPHLPVARTGPQSRAQRNPKDGETEAERVLAQGRTAAQGRGSCRFRRAS